MSDHRPDIEIECSSIAERDRILKAIENVAIDIGYWANISPYYENRTRKGNKIILPLDIILLEGKSKSIEHEHIASFIMSSISGTNGKISANEKKLNEKIKNEAHSVRVYGSDFDVAKLPDARELEPEAPEPAITDHTVHHASGHITGVAARALTLKINGRQYAVEDQDLTAAIEVIVRSSPYMRIAYMLRQVPGAGYRRMITREAMLQLARNVAVVWGAQPDLLAHPPSESGSDE